MIVDLDEQTGNDVPTLDLGVNQRIDELLSILGKDKSVQVSGRSWKSLSRYSAGQEAPFAVVAALALAAGKSLDWLATGREGAQPAPDGFKLIPRLDTQASAGAGALVEAERAYEVLAFREDWLRRRGINPSATHVLSAKGDSMEPTIRDGDILLVDTSIDRVMDNAIYVVVFAGRTLVKRLQLRRDGSVLIRSDNSEAFSDEVVPPSEVTELIVAGRVMWYGRSI
jgi:phage repressor protein C with HTH and peptisase S24 domain